MTTDATPLKYLDKALGTIRDLGLMPEDASSAQDPMVALLNQISVLDEERVIAIARTLSQASVFNTVVREQGWDEKGEEIPMGRAAKPEEIADLVALADGAQVVELPLLDVDIHDLE